MAKRRPGTELNHDNWEDEGEPEEKGSWTTASEAELSKRVIKTARRRNPADKPAGSISAFGGFSGFTASTPSTTAPSSIFAFLSQDKKKDGEDEKKAEDSKKEEPKTTSPSSGDKEYHQKLRALNQSLCDWIKQHVDKDPICILTPIFKDYEKHLKDIETTKTTNGTTTAPSTFPSTKSSTEEKLAATTAFKGFSFGSSAPPPTSSSTTSSATPSLFGGTPSSNSTLSNFSTAPKISFGSTPSTGSSLFGKSPEPSAGGPLVPSASTGFSFGGAKPFSFGNTGPPPAAAAEEKKDDAEGEDDDEDQPPKVEFKAVVEEDSVYSKRCKVFFKVDGNFQERGIGTIFVKPVKDSPKHQMIVRADTSLGNILVNLVLAKGMPVKKMGTNNVMLVCIPNTDFDKPVSVLLKVKTAADADEVIEKLNSYSAE